VAEVTQHLQNAWPKLARALEPFSQAMDRRFAETIPVCKSMDELASRDVTLASYVEGCVVERALNGFGRDMLDTTDSCCLSAQKAVNLFY
jgi:hypothetical protein